MKYATSGILLSLCLTQFAAAQSKEETEKFLAGKLSGRVYSDEQGKLSFKDGKMTYVRKLEYDYAPYVREYVSTVHLSQLNPRYIKTGEISIRGTTHYIIDLHTTNKSRSIQQEVYHYGPGKRTLQDSLGGKVYDLGLRVKDARTQDQVVKGLRHLITLYGGKGELFE